jgi:SAM-dependent methyltransferase
VAAPCALGAIVTSNYEDQAEAYGRHRSHNEALLRELASGGGLTQGSRVLEILLARATGVRVKPGSAEELPFEACEFDFAFAVQVIHHVTDREGFFAEAFRVLDKCGTPCVVTESHEPIRNPCDRNGPSFQ